MPEPDLQNGIDYWKSQPASLNGVLGIFSCVKNWCQEANFVFEKVVLVLG